MRRGFLLFVYFISILSVILLFMQKCGAKGTCFFLSGLCKQNYTGDVSGPKEAVIIVDGVSISTTVDATTVRA